MSRQTTTSRSDSLLPFTPADETESLLAFQFNENGQPKVIAEFRSERDRWALYCFAQAILAEMIRKDGINAATSMGAVEAA